MLALGGVKIYELVWFYRKNSNDLRGSPSLVTPPEDRPLPGGTGNPNQSQEARGCLRARFRIYEATGGKSQKGTWLSKTDHRVHR